MKRLSLLFIAVFALAFTAYAQVAPTHGQYVSLGSDSKAWYEAYNSWQMGTPLYNGLDEAENENFFISRVKPRDRFVYTGTTGRLPWYRFRVLSSTFATRTVSQPVRLLQYLGHRPRKSMTAGTVP